jgi:hypothetical protein
MLPKKLSAVIPAIAFPAHTAQHIGLFQHLMNIIATELAAPIRVENKTCGWLLTPKSHLKGIEHQLFLLFCYSSTSQRPGGKTDPG